jgi:hypothetical protein
MEREGSYSQKYIILELRSAISSPPDVEGM